MSKVIQQRESRLPAEGGFSGSPLRTVVVGLNLNGQIFFQHQLVSDLVLEQRLRAAVTNAPHPLAMVLQADRKVPFEKIVALSNIARRAGVAEMVFATRPASGP